MGQGPQAAKSLFDSKGAIGKQFTSTMKESESCDESLTFLQLRAPLGVLLKQSVDP